MTAMNQDTMSWQEQMQDESLVSATGGDEFSNFLEFGINFPDLDGHSSAQPESGLHASNHAIATTMADESMNRMDTQAQGQTSQYNHMMGDLPMDLSQQGQSQGQSYNGMDVDNAFFQEQQQQHQHQQELCRQQSQQHPHHGYAPGQPMVPPTPNSVELHGGAARYPQRVEENTEMYDRYGRVNDDQVRQEMHINDETKNSSINSQQAFYTPLISPAMTPLETQFRLPEYTIPGEYFTPLTSPALEARGSNSGYPFHTTQAQEMGYIHSPVDANGVPVSSPASPGLQRKQRRRPSATTRVAGRASKQSPVVRAQTRRKQALSSQLQSEEIANALSQDPRVPTNGSSNLRFGSTESSQDSVSPEPLSEPLMPPPALPQARKSPAIEPQTSEPKNDAVVTPATLMRIQKAQHAQDPSGRFRGQASLVPSNNQHDEVMEDIQLPGAAADNRPGLTRIDTAVRSGEHTPTTSAKPTPSLEPRSAVDRAASASVAPSPRTGPMPSPSGPVGRKPDPKAGIRKRQSVSSQISPALRPRISPSIQPLVRSEAGVSTETSALYLASKSNYQHILDGTLLPGVSYPETLAENLSSKRTNHKLAEQGRRNRINTALKEIETLLPPGFAQERAKDSPSGGAKNAEKEKNGNPAISKASTVEMAIDYIKALKKELEDTQHRLKVAESKLHGTSSESDAGATASAVETKTETPNSSEASVQSSEN
ncbi:HLH transcription factor (PalcA), putative [Paecilomyces variotii No. 5]|uniref:HLH transcription factor (PalcA), putative n=1 Tax=Byssochlamys spectabilis (strain No. 5 / NBRC 109023) TaxID=1356009 RepID=V5FSH1_BYSSN|nr:HLH transcription factor (PalcA), putative [Paecilomyces variotii No. 5]